MWYNISMKLPGKQIAEALQVNLKQEVQILKKKGIPLKLVDILIGEADDQISFVKIKEKMAQKLGVEFEFVHLIKTPSFENFANILKGYSVDPKVTGIIVQQPLPFQLQTDSLYNFIPLSKEIEGHKLKTTFCAPLGLAILTALKYVFKGSVVSADLFVDLSKDTDFFKKNLRSKKVVIIGRGMTGGLPIGETFKKLKLDFLSVASQTFEPHAYYKDADIIITAVGKKIITSDMLKPGAVLLNVGLRREDEKLRGDYEEDEVKDVSSLYSSTPGGIGPIDVVYLFKNLLDASKLQNYQKFH